MATSLFPPLSTEQQAMLERAAQRFAENQAKLIPNTGQAAVAVAEVIAPKLQHNFYTLAERFIELGAYVAPVEPESKVCKLPDWQNKATRDLAQARAWSIENPRYNCAIVGKPDGLWGFDDDGGILPEYESVHGRIPTYRTKTVSGGTHLLFKASAASAAMGNLDAKSDSGKELFSCRVDNRYVLSAGSVAHPHNDLSKPLASYDAVEKTPPIEAPDSFIEWLKQRAKPGQMKKTGHAELDDESIISDGGRNTALTSILGKARQLLKMDKEQLLAYGLSVNEKRCRPPLEESEVRTIATSISNYVVKESGGLVFKDAAAPVAQVIPVEFETESINPTHSAVDSIDYLPSSVLASKRLEDIFFTHFEPNDWPLTLALPALVTAASVVVPYVRQEGLVLGDNAMTNLYTALIGDAGSGKTQITNWAATGIGIYEGEGNIGSHYFEGKWGSAEQMLKSLHKKQIQFTGKSVLITPDEWSHLFAKAAIPDASFPSVLTTSFYRRNQIFTLGGRDGGKEYILNLAMSFIGGIVEDEFDTVFGSASLGGLYDRFLFGRAPNGFMWDYVPCPIPQAKHWLNWDLKPVQVNPSVHEVVKGWNRENQGLGRVAEICTRVATIYACLDGRSEVTGKDIEILKPLALYQVGLRQVFRPNPGKNPDAIFANTAMAWIQKNADGWTSIAKLKQRTWRVEQDLGPAVAVRSLIGLARSGRIDLWLTEDGKQTPPDYTGPRPRIGLVRRVK
jgi:hypothetical protein